MNDANKPCYCGSGKKTKKCHPNERKPRTINIDVEFYKTETVNRFEINHLTGKIDAYNNDKKLDMKSVIINQGYERPKKRKILNQMSMPA